jgi:CRISPR-associated protein Csb2
VIPLPFVGHEHASGSILGLALVLPREATHEERRAVYRAVDKWERRYRQEDEDAPVVQLNLGAAGTLGLERVDWGAPLVSLRAETWCAPARIWYSVTPVALDRNPGDLRSQDPLKVDKALREAADIVARACERIRLPHPKTIEILPAAPWPGASKARHYPPYPSDPARTQRILTHVAIEFDAPVRGPVIIGAGRYLGLGLFRPGVGR